MTSKSGKFDVLSEKLEGVVPVFLVGENKGGVCGGLWRGVWASHSQNGFSIMFAFAYQSCRNGFLDVLRIRLLIMYAEMYHNVMCFAFAYYSVMY